MPVTSPHLGNFAKSEPVAIGGAITAVLNALVLLKVVDLSAEQIGGINVALAAILALFVRSQVTPTAKAADERGEIHAGFSGLVALLLVVALSLYILSSLGHPIHIG